MEVAIAVPIKGTKKKKYVYKILKLLGIKSNCFNTYFSDSLSSELDGFVLSKKYGLVNFYSRNGFLYVSA